MAGGPLGRTRTRLPGWRPGWQHGEPRERRADGGDTEGIDGGTGRARQGRPRISAAGSGALGGNNSRRSRPQSSSRPRARRGSPIRPRRRRAPTSASRGSSMVPRRRTARSSTTCTTPNAGIVGAPDYNTRMEQIQTGVLGEKPQQTHTLNLILVRITTTNDAAHRGSTAAAPAAADGAPVSVTDAQFRELLRGQSGRARAARGDRVRLPDRGRARHRDDLPLGRRSTARRRASRRRARAIGRDHEGTGLQRAIDYAKLGGRAPMTPAAQARRTSTGSRTSCWTMIIDGREVRFYAGRGGDHPWPRADFRQVNAALVAVGEGPAKGEITIALRDKTICSTTRRRRRDRRGPNAGKPETRSCSAASRISTSRRTHRSANLVPTRSTISLDERGDAIELRRRARRRP
jgi:hypothetical protein